jgi:hypothetical protein
MFTLVSRSGAPLILVALHGLLLVGPAWSGGNEGAGFSISGVEARLYYHEGALSGERDRDGRIPGSLRRATL